MLSANYGIKLDIYKLTELHNQKTVNYDLVATVVNNAMLTATMFRAYNVSADTESHDKLVNCMNLFRHMFGQKQITWHWIDTGE